MCILAIKPQGALVPSDEILKRMFHTNPDGGGISYAQGGKIYIIKGLMTESEFLDECHKIPVDSTALIHTRIQTSGGTCQQLTHPYPLTNDYEQLTATKVIISKGFAVGHNGIFSGFGSKEGYNDTIQFIGNILTPIEKMCRASKKSILDKSLIPVINKLVDTSRLAIMDTFGNYEKYGNGWTEDNGVWYSNTGYKPYVYQPSFKDYKDYYYDDEDEWSDTYSHWASGGGAYYNKSYKNLCYKPKKTDDNLEKLVKDYPVFEPEIRKYVEDYEFPVDTIRQWAEKGWLGIMEDTSDVKS
jgi:hypothetical protein